MKITRIRRLNRTLNFYKNNFRFRSPYQVLIDATFCQAALKCKVNIREQLPKYLGEVKLMTTACVVTEAELLGPPVYGATLVVKQFLLRKCGHEKNPISASECLLSMIEGDNPDHYFIATQDSELSEKVNGHPAQVETWNIKLNLLCYGGTLKVRKIPGAPLLYTKFNAIILEKPSDVNELTANEKASEKFNISDYHATLLKQMKKDVFGEQEIVKKKRKKNKGPNPLSCKKKQKKPAAKSTEEHKIRKRKRHHRVHIPKHIKDM